MNARLPGSLHRSRRASCSRGARRRPRSWKAVRRRLGAMVVASILLASSANAEPGPAPTLAVRAGWAYGLGVELEYRPRSWGVGASGGYVPGLGAGGYLGVQWGMRPLARSGVVAEAGLFRGVHNPFRVAQTGVGVYTLAGYTVRHGARLSARAVVGGGVPLGDPAHPVSFEVLAKLTIGVTF